RRAAWSCPRRSRRAAGTGLRRPARRSPPPRCRRTRRTRSRAAGAGASAGRLPWIGLFFPGLLERLGEKLPLAQGGRLVPDVLHELGGHREVVASRYPGPVTALV